MAAESAQGPDCPVQCSAAAECSCFTQVCSGPTLLPWHCPTVPSTTESKASAVQTRHYWNLHLKQVRLSSSLPLLQCTVLVSPAPSDEPWDSSSQVTLFSSSSTIFPPKFLLSLPWASQPLYRESPLPVILHLWAVNKRCMCSFGGWCKHHLHIPSLQKQLVAEEACQHFSCMLFCFHCFDEIHL